jgi:hypothetical protein
MGNIIRKIKIHKIVPVLSEQELEIINFIENKLDNLKEFIYPIYKDRDIFYMNDKGDMILDIDYTRKQFYIRYQGFWKILQDHFKLEETEIKLILKYFLEHKLKIDIIFEILDGDVSHYKDIENEYRLYNHPI